MGMAHPLITYCHKHHISLHRLASRLGVSSSTLYRLVRPPSDRVRRPSAELMGWIERETGGEVTIVDLHAIHYGPSPVRVCPRGINGKGKEQDLTVPGGA